LDKRWLPLFAKEDSDQLTMVERVGEAMSKRTIFLASVAALLWGAIASVSAQEKFVVNFEQDGRDVVATGSGTLDLTDLKLTTIGRTYTPTVQPDVGIFISGQEGGVLEELFTGVSSRVRFGTGHFGQPTTSSGDRVGVDPTFSTLIVPIDYASGSALSNQSTYFNATFDTLGLAPGTYRYDWGSGDHADAFTINIGSVSGSVPEPSTWAMMALGFAGLVYARSTQRRYSQSSPSPSACPRPQLGR
jgi:hypothetical protein